MEGGRFGYFRFYFIINSSSITLDQGLAGRIDGMDGRLNARIDSLDHSLNARIDSLDRNLNTRIDALDRRFDTMDRKISRQFTWLVGIQVALLLGVIGALVQG